LKDKFSGNQATAKQDVGTFCAEVVLCVRQDV